MRTLFLLRHGKSDRGPAEGDDRSRPLSPRGTRAAQAMGRFLARSGTIPDLALTSPTVRTTATLQLAMEAGQWSCEVASSDALYAGVPEVLAELRRQNGTTGVLLVVGHEPTSSELTGLLIGGGAVRMPTAALARVDLDIDAWTDVVPRIGTLNYLVYPRLVRALDAGA